MVLWCAQSGHGLADQAALPRVWYTKKVSVSFEDILRTLRRVPVRIGEFGPLTYQNDNILLARLGRDRYSKIKLLNIETTPLLSAKDQSELYAYKIVNFVNGNHTVAEIRDAVSAEYGPLPISLVTDYLDACVEAKVIQRK